MLFPLIPDKQIISATSFSLRDGWRVTAPDGKRLGEQMSKKISVAVALAGMCALSLFLLSCGSSSSRPSGLLYVLTQGSNGVGNSVSSFSIDLDSGNLSLINSNASTCSTASPSCGLPLNILLDPTGAAAFVLNQGVPCQHQGTTCALDNSGKPTVSVPPTIYPYTVNSDGSFSNPGTAIPLSHPMSATDTQDDADNAVVMVRDATGQFLFVMNQGSNPPPANCLNDPLPQGNFDACPSISVFGMHGSSSLTLVGGSLLHPGSPLHLSRIPTALSAITLPAGAPAQELLFVTSNSDPVNHNDNTVSVYAVAASDGTLTEQPGSPFATATIDPLSVLAVNTSPAGQPSVGRVFVYVGGAGNASGALDLFQVCTVVNSFCTSPDFSLVPVGTPTSTGQNPVAMVVDPTNNFLYVVCYGSSQVYGYQINTTTGVLTAPVNQPTGSQPVALALHPSVNNTGQFLFTSNSVSSNISGFTLSTTNGSMSSPTTTTSPAGPSGMAAR